GILPVFDAYEVIDDLLHHVAIILRLCDPLPAQFELADEIKHLSDGVMLPIAPLLPELLECLRMEPGMDVLPGLGRLVLDRPVDLLLVLRKDIEQRPGGALHGLDIADLEEREDDEVDVPQPGLVVAGGYRMRRGGIDP